MGVWSVGVRSFRGQDFKFVGHTCQDLEIRVGSLGFASFTVWILGLKFGDYLEQRLTVSGLVLRSLKVYAGSKKSWRHFLAMSS